MTASDTTTLISCKTAGPPTTVRWIRAESAVSAALTSSDTSNKKPIETTRPNDRSRLRISRFKPDFLGSVLTRKIVLIACCNSRNAPLAAMINVTEPMITASVPVGFLCAP